MEVHPIHSFDTYLCLCSHAFDGLVQFSIFKKDIFLCHCEHQHLKVDTFTKNLTITGEGDMPKKVNMNVRNLYGLNMPL